MKFNHRYKVILLVIGWLTSLVVTFEIGSLSTELEHIFEPITESTSIRLNGKNEFFLKKYIWGLLGNHRIIYLTKSSNQKFPDEEKDMIFQKAETVFIKACPDSLIIYIRKGTEIKNEFNDNATIQIKRLENSEFMALYDEYYTQLICTDWL